MNKLPEKYMELLTSIVRRSLANTDYKAFIFGSWAVGNARPNSDIDIGIESPSGMIDKIIIENLSNELLESDIPNLTQVVPFDDLLSDDFKKVSLTKIIPLTKDESK